MICARSTAPPIKQLVHTMKTIAPLVSFLNEPLLDARRPERRAHGFFGEEGAA
jgi:hypothetical protein